MTMMNALLLNTGTLSLLTTVPHASSFFTEHPHMHENNPSIPKER